MSADFRTSYLRYDDLTGVVKGWAEKHPSLVRLTSIGKSLEERDLWLLEIGPDPDRARPAAWVDGNMHASEVCGSSVALAIAEDVIHLHLGIETPSTKDLPPHVKERLKNILFYVLPRVCPDGAEVVLGQGRYVRSNVRDRRVRAPTPRWVQQDIDGDGFALSMRKKDPSGEYVEDPDLPGVMLPRRLEDTGPFWKVWPEGVIENFDGSHVPDPYFLSDNDTDLNRNFPFSWVPEPEQPGAGAFATSEPESRSIVEWVSTRPHIFCWLNLHTFGGCFIRPLGHQPDTKMDPMDLAVFKQVAEWCESITGYPVVSGYEQFTYEPDKPLHGDLSDFAYHMRGAIAYVCELWDLFARLGVKRPSKFVEYYTHLTREDLKALVKLDAEINHKRIFRGWKRVKHPQLGEVEVGGVAPVVGVFNPPYELIGEICAKQAAAYFRVAAMAPSLEMSEPVVRRAGETSRVQVTIKNSGYLPTYVLSSAKSLAIDARVFVEVDASGASIDSRDARIEIGHLEGWGRGLHTSSIFYQRSRGSVSERTVCFVVHGRGKVRIRAKGLRAGSVEREVEV
jgi:hypothetical protein